MRSTRFVVLAVRARWAFLKRNGSLPAPSLSRRAATHRRQYLKSHLTEVTVSCECVRQPELTHRHTARAVGEGEVFVAVLEEQLAGFLEPIAVDAFPPEPRAPIDLLPPPFGSHQAEPEPKQRQRFIDDEVSCDQRLGRSRALDHAPCSIECGRRPTRRRTPSSQLCRRTRPSPFVQDRIMVRRGSSVTRSPDRASVIERIID
jgi:hypothetical protein